jgi:chromosome segregation ATPase|mmetsp:Transcript_49796/g.78798  ORF Transcript_49796/g.78798 Transcript_49796/m.78798 type:complete len:658 (+) Transcript_49796:55-2028(+)
MVRDGIFIATAVLAVVCQHIEATAVTPVQKVLTMMTEMKTKGEAMMAEEAKTYASYKEWVSDTSTELGFEIKTGKSDIEKYTAEAAKADSDVDELSSAISKLENELGTIEGEKKETTEVRESQHAEYVTMSTDYSESVAALEGAIQTLAAKDYDVPQAAALLQKMAATKPGMRRVVAAFMQETQRQESSRGGPAVAAYEFQSGGIVALLEKLLAKFKNELDDVETEESNQAHNYDLEMIQLSDTIDYLKKEIEEKTVFKTKRSSASAQAKANLASTKEELAEDEKTLSDMTATFESKTSTFHANQEVRKSELEAIAKAIEIISNPTVAESYSEHINLAQTKTSLLQLRSAKSRVTSRQRVAAFLQRKAQLLSSTELKNLAAQVATNPFDKVIEMIKDLLSKLKEEAAAEAEHKAWCDEQLHNNKLKREKKTARVNKLAAEIEALTESIASMAKKIDTLAKEQADLAKAMSEATAQRQTEKTTNTDTMKDAAAGEEATKAALVILKEFYASQSSFLQNKKQVPEMAAYKGMQNAKGGVVGMLEVISSDFARLFAETKANEESAAAEYATFMKDATASKKAKHDLEYKTSLEKDQTDFEKSQTTKDLRSTQEELDKALEYQQYLKPVCLEVHVSYEERVAHRKEEIEALKEAYEILDKK